MYPKVLKNIPVIGISMCMHTGSAATGSERLARLGCLSTGRSEGIEIEMTEIEHEQGSCHSPSAGVLRTSEYAGSREGVFSQMHAIHGVAACPMLPLMSDLESSALQLSMQDPAKVHCFSQMQQARSVCRWLTRGLTYKGVEEA